MDIFRKPTPPTFTQPQGGVADNVTGKFDPTALERGAKALKDLDASPNSQKAFELVLAQERTKQMEMQVQSEASQTERIRLQNQKIAADSEEQRKTATHREDEERRTAQYKSKLEAELHQKKMKDALTQQERQLKAQEELSKKQENHRRAVELEIEAARRKTMEYQSDLDQKRRLEEIKAEVKAKATADRENIDIKLQEIQTKASDNFKLKMAQLDLITSRISNGISAFANDKAVATSCVLGITSLAIGVYGARSLTSVAGRLAYKYLSTPKLVTETSRFSYTRPVCSMIKAWKRKKSSLLDSIVLNEDLQTRVSWLGKSVVTSKKNGIPFGHTLLYGPPGTGKTLLARTLAQKTGLDYAILTGGDIAALGNLAVSELNSLFSWANTSRKGTIIFIDECESFLRKGRGNNGDMSEETRNALSTFLAHTGTEQSNFMLVMATNVPEALDPAVLDRIDETLELGLPAYNERLEMLRLYINKQLKGDNNGTKIGLDEYTSSEEFLENLAKQTEGFSGRQLNKFVTSLRRTVTSSGSDKLTKGLADIVLQWELSHLKNEISKKI